MVGRGQQGHRNQGLDPELGRRGHFGMGGLSIDVASVPTGQMSVRLENWRHRLGVFGNAPMVSPGTRNQAQSLLGGLANPSGGHEDIDMMLNCANGAMAQGPIQLGPAPRIILR